MARQALINPDFPFQRSEETDIAAHGQMTDEEVQSLLGIKKTRAFELIKKMREMELIHILGRGSEKKYVASKN